MKTSRKLLALAFSLIAATGFAVAGPSNPASSFSGVPSVSQRHGCPMVTPVAHSLATTNPKGAAAATQTTSYRHEGCTRTAENKLTCKPSQTSCQAMRQS
ncbi:hypothetical protein TSACC_21734 [Terrimicrobium sacchariphilum]|uniref:Uncharacterized protein n=1 Tax=Terrimicrobium sacchariphilum TaxID=690879 RepID=A0A146G6X4_TERSA|nr:hypothetical protein [Terrimicrobium sacchariphilum]GAT33320.1 hypothetical protein TSACC_21734 [Terrimicrobium sacchariphilum]